MKPYRFFRVYSRKNYEGDERRLKPRIYYPIPIKVRTTGCCGERLEFDIFADDLSAGGFSAHTTMECQPGQNLFLVMKFSLQKGMHLQATTVAAKGKVLRSEKRFNGYYVFASTVDRHKFI